MLTEQSDPAAIEDLLERLHPRVAPTGLRRLGPDGDGGYLVPDDLDGIAACFSPGVGTLAGFEMDCAELGLRTHLADASVDAAPHPDPRLDFRRVFIRAVAGPEAITLEQWVAELEPDPADDLLLQIDIEGDEWSVLLGTPRPVLERFRIIVAEFHRMQGLLERTASSMQAPVFEKLLETHVCVHIHPNNCCGTATNGRVVIPRTAEFTFLRRDRIDLAQAGHAQLFPHPLDADCTGRAPLALQASMYRAR